MKCFAALGNHTKLDIAIAEKQTSPALYGLQYFRLLDWNIAGRANGDLLVGPHLKGVGKITDTEFGSLQIDEYGYRREVRAIAAHPFDPATALIPIAMAAVKASHVHAAFYECRDFSFGINGRTEGANNFGATGHGG